MSQAWGLHRLTCALGVYNMHYRIYCDDVLIYDPRAMTDDLTVSSPKLKLEPNVAGCLTFSIAPNHPHYRYIFPFRSIIDVYRDNTCIWRGRVMEDKTAFDRTQSKTCEGALAFLNDIQYPPDASSWQAKRIDGWLNSILYYYNEHALDSRKIYLGHVNVNVADPDRGIVYKPHGYKSCMEVLTDILQLAGGYVRIRIESDHKAYLDYDYAMPGSDGSGDTKHARFGINLLDLTKEAHIEGFANAIIPLGAPINDNDYDRTTISTLPDGSIGNTGYKKDGVYILDESSINIFGRFEAAVNWDDVTDKSALRALGCRYLAAATSQTMKIDASFIDMNYLDPSQSPIDLYDPIAIFSIPHDYTSGSTTPLLGIEIDLSDFSNNKYSISKNQATTMTDYILRHY